MTVSAKSKFVFSSAILLLCLCAAASYLSFYYFRASERWVSHTQEVRAATGEVEQAVDIAARERLSYLLTGDESGLTRYRAAVVQVNERMQVLQNLVRDNSLQRANAAQLAQVTHDRLQTWEEAIARRQHGENVDVSQLIPQNLDLAARSAGASGEVRDEENRLLPLRMAAAHRRFLLTSAMVVGSFSVAILLLLYYYRVLQQELQLREGAERLSNAAYEQEVRLRQEEQRFRLFIDAVKDYAIFTLDPRGRVSSWNEGAFRLKGYRADEIVGRHFSVFYPQEDIRGGKPEMELEVAKKEGRIEDEGWRLRKDGTRFWANVIITAIRDSAGELIGFSKVTRDFSERRRAQGELQEANVNLLAEVTERKLAEKRLASSEKSLRELSRHLLRSQDEERKRIGRDLHDSLGQSLAVLKMNLDSLDLEVGTEQNGTAARAVNSCANLAEEALREVRTISYLLYPPMLEEMGLKSAIPWYLDGFSKRSNIKTSFEVDAGFDRLPPEVELALFRILQESLTNIHRHSGSATAKIKLSLANGWAVMEIQDEGNGIPPGLLEQSGEDWMGSLGVGLRGMNERMRQLGGRLEVSSAESGTVVTAGVPAEKVQPKLNRTA
jgi:PAS domain S-box-containing protein